MNISKNEFSTVTTKPLCRSLPIEGYEEVGKLGRQIINEVKYLVMFIGYSRSGHSLIGSLLDAHPDVVIANEYNLLEKWLEFDPNHRNKEHLFQQLYLNSYNESRKGDRSAEDCIYKTKYNYLVPNQWQGTFNKTIKVNGCRCFC